VAVKMAVSVYKFKMNPTRISFRTNILRNAVWTTL